MRGGRCAVLLSALCITACSAHSTVGSQGPLNAGVNDRGTVCIPASANATVTMGGEVLRNTGHTEVIIDRVSLADPHGLVLVESVVLAIAGNTVGYEATYPPPADALARPGVNWSGRKPAVGATVAPGPAPGTTNLVTGIRLTDGGEPSTSGIVIDYHVKGGHSYRLTTSVGLVAKVSPAKCIQ